MQNSQEGSPLFSASDLVNFLGCTHSTVLDLANLVQPQQFSDDDEQTKLLQELGIAHERNYLASLKEEGLLVAEIPDTGGLAERVRLTLDAMRSGADVIYQGALHEGQWHGYSDFLLKVDGVSSNLGNFAYDVADTKLSRSAKPKHIIQLCVYADLLATIQGIDPPNLHVVLGNGDIASLKTSAVRHYYATARDRFVAYIGEDHGRSLAEPCGHCTYCRWHDACDAGWERSDHLSRVANISRNHTLLLRQAGIDTLAALASSPDALKIAELQPAIFERLKAQARLQLAKRETGENRVELLPLDVTRGFARLPRSDAGDLFFDMEGDPLVDGGLEYLFGVVTIATGGNSQFDTFWGHDRAAEKVAFETAVDFMTDRLAQYPQAHIYHYGSYEETALKRLAMVHGTRENAVDNLLRQRKLVDLYQVVREAVRVSEPRYSIKNIENFYLDAKRAGEVTTAGDSIVMYERWRRLADQQLLDDIARYNEADCVSTRGCRDWLLGLRPANTNWFEGVAGDRNGPENEAKRNEAAEKTRQVAEALSTGATADDREWRSLLADMLEFHRREAKPGYWAMFSRQFYDEPELIDDAECLGALIPDETRPPYPDKRSTVFSFKFPPQDFKMRLDDDPVRPISLEPAGTIVALDEEEGTISLKLGPSRSPLGNRLGLIPPGPLDDRILRGAIFRFAEAVIAGRQQNYPALVDVLKRSQPRIAGTAIGSAVVEEGNDIVAGTVTALEGLESSVLLIQGPPGAGKTYTASHAIVGLLASGKRIGVASNSHKAINKLLADVEALAAEQGVGFRGIKKSSRDDQKLNGTGAIADTLSNDDVNAGHQLVAGTAWLFAREALDQALDYLFIDEAGQVSLANVIAMGVSARNIVLIGDQMQLAQPIQGTHPGGSGVSGLDHLMNGLATVPPDRGVFLPISRRMHPDICGFISDAVYDGRLSSHDETRGQKLILSSEAAKLGIAPTGIRFVPVNHQGRAQRSPEEVGRIADVYNQLLVSRWVDKDGVERQVTYDDILVVSPYNMQVDLLRSTLPQGARVGTVDKFQGQEAAVVLISMATSSGDDLPRQIEFLYSRNRLNVAISRARCLAMLFASPRLLEIPCHTIAQMELVNALCWVRSYSEMQARHHMTLL